MLSGSFEFECSCFEGAILNTGSKKCEIEKIDPCTALGCSEDKKCRYDFMGNPSCVCKNVKLVFYQKLVKNVIKFSIV